MTIAPAHELAPHGGMAVAVTPGWMRSEAMLDTFGVTEENWRDATESEPLSSGQLARIYGFIDTGGTQPDCWRYIVEMQDRDLPANDSGYR
jgi:hypothetical protein